MCCGSHVFFKIPDASDDPNTPYWQCEECQSLAKRNGEILLEESLLLLI